jgi:hypothetical protein
MVIRSREYVLQNARIVNVKAHYMEYVGNLQFCVNVCCNKAVGMNNFILFKLKNKNKL